MYPTPSRAPNNKHAILKQMFSKCAETFGTSRTVFGGASDCRHLQRWGALEEAETVLLRTLEVPTSSAAYPRSCLNGSFLVFSF